MMGNIETGFLTESSYLSPRRLKIMKKKKRLFWDQVRLFNRRRIALKVFKGEVVEPKIYILNMQCNVERDIKAIA